MKELKVNKIRAGKRLSYADASKRMECNDKKVAVQEEPELMRISAWTKEGLWDLLQWL